MFGAGQPQIPLVLGFNVTNLEISASGASIWNPQVIVATNEAFSLGATFSGNGFVWNGLKNSGIQYNVAYFAEGLGAHAPEVDLGVASANLTPAVNVYSPGSAPSTKLNIAPGTLPPGVYQIACLVTFTGWPGLTGFFEGLVIEVYAP